MKYLFISLQEYLQCFIPRALITCTFSMHFWKFLFSGGPLEVSTKLRGCELTFSWTGGSRTSYDVVIEKDKVGGEWEKTNDRYYTVADALKYNSIKIEVRNEGIGNGRVLEYKGEHEKMWCYCHC